MKFIGDLLSDQIILDIFLIHKDKFNWLPSFIKLKEESKEDFGLGATNPIVEKIIQNFKCLLGDEAFPQPSYFKI